MTNNTSVHWVKKICTIRELIFCILKNNLILDALWHRGRECKDLDQVIDKIYFLLKLGTCSSFLNQWQMFKAMVHEPNTETIYFFINRILMSIQYLDQCIKSKVCSLTLLSLLACWKRKLQAIVTGVTAIRWCWRANWEYSEGRRSGRDGCGMDTVQPQLEPTWTARIMHELLYIFTKPYANQCIQYGVEAAACVCQSASNVLCHQSTERPGHFLRKNHCVW